MKESLVRPSSFFFLYLVIFGLSCAQRVGKLPPRPTTWTIRTLDNGSIYPESQNHPKDIGALAAAIFDPEFNLHTVYNAFGQLRYGLYPATPRDSNILHRSLGARSPSTSSEGFKRLETIPFSFDPESNKITISVDRSTRPHLVFPGRHGLQYMVLSNAGWTMGLISDHALKQKPWDLIFDSKDLPILAVNHAESGLVINRLTASGWQEERVPTAPEASQGNLMCLKAQIRGERIYFSFVTHEESGARLWMSNSSTATLLYSFAARQMSDCAIAHLPSGQPVVAWTGWTGNKWEGREILVYVSPSRAAYKPLILEDALPSAREAISISLEMSPKGTPHLLMQNPNTGALRYYSQDQKKQWFKTALAQGTPVKKPPVLTLDPQGRPWVLFQDAQQGTLNLARKE